MEECNKLIIPEVEADFSLLSDNPQAFSEAFDQLGRPGTLENAPWKDFPDKPSVNFRIAWSGDKLILKFTVREREILGTSTKDYSDVFKDSCVEIFLSPEGKDYYYNFEFNCVGACLAQRGTERAGREELPECLLDQVVRIPSLPIEPVHLYHEGLADEAPVWSLLVVLPAEVFSEEVFADFKALRMRGNLYKCGDGLEKPHYLCWNKIETENPDFHRPEFFGELWFS
ncbi:MAG: carbohydrate-binding family 9-like protein [Spirochaetales bacterium]|nr:carbohydrate-binding family 9-like protein [Spirochaetales bacterium]